MRGLRSSRVKAVKKDTLIVTVDVGMASNMGYCTTGGGIGCPYTPPTYTPKAQEEASSP
jgi:hypothetical protein